MRLFKLRVFFFNELLQVCWTDAWDALCTCISTQNQCHGSACHGIVNAVEQGEISWHISVRPLASSSRHSHTLEVLFFCVEKISRKLPPASPPNSTTTKSSLSTSYDQSPAAFSARTPPPSANDCSTQPSYHGLSTDILESAGGVAEGIKKSFCSSRRRLPPTMPPNCLHFYTF